MTEPQVAGITVTEAGDRVVIEVPAGRWEGTALDAERLLTRLHYALARARPGTNIASVFLDGKLWGGKSVETDRRAAIRDMRILIDQLARKLAELDEGVAGDDPELTTSA